MNLNKRMAEWSQGIIKPVDPMLEKNAIKRLQEQKDIEPEKYFEKLIECKLENYDFPTTEIIRLFSTGGFLVTLDFPALCEADLLGAFFLVTDEHKDQELAEEVDEVKIHAENLIKLFKKCGKDFQAVYSVFNELARNSANRVFQGWHTETCMIKMCPANESVADGYLTITGVVRLVLMMQKNPEN